MLTLLCLINIFIAFFKKDKNLEKIRKINCLKNIMGDGSLPIFLNNLYNYKNFEEIIIEIDNVPYKLIALHYDYSKDKLEFEAINIINNKTIYIKNKYISLEQLTKLCNMLS